MDAILPDVSSHREAERPHVSLTLLTVLAIVASCEDLLSCIFPAFLSELPWSPKAVLEVCPELSVCYAIDEHGMVCFILLSLGGNHLLF